jgi:hypothetical protein
MSRRDMPCRPHRHTAGRARRSEPATAGPRPRSASTVCLRGVTRCPPLGRCHAAAAHTPTRAPPSAIGRRPAACRQPPPRHAVATVANEAQEKPSRDVARPIKTLLSLNSRAPEQHSRSPPSAISASGELPPPLVPATTQAHKLLP